MREYAFSSEGPATQVPVGLPVGRILSLDDNSVYLIFVVCTCHLYLNRLSLLITACIVKRTIRYLSMRPPLITAQIQNRCVAEENSARLWDAHICDPLTARRSAASFPGSPACPRICRKYIRFESSPLTTRSATPRISLTKSRFFTGCVHCDASHL
jgi:hypothetical protein